MQIFGDTARAKNQISEPAAIPICAMNWPGGGIHPYAPRPGRSGVALR